ncbi:transcription factor [Ganoderma sinense ZZ0214-1]|uniref:Transcription factor n=1 Tax=Ganoderma sinense ZZ0214-1 TaxID=1077348 RepID=A0A2G8SDV9_9APHY|nr:transcription factor [Ganoderma sinense ZZ0214-1]
MIPILQRIRDSAGTTARKFGTVASVAATDDYTFPNHRRFALPTPEPLTPQLLALGVDECSASRISSALLRVSLLLRRDFETGVQRLLRTQNHSSAVLSTFVTIYKRTIQQWTSYLLDDITPRVLRAQSLHRSLGEPSATEFIERKRPFNASAIPILEQFFEQNAFPSRLEKIELASKCDMDFKQIHIWFQNRRTRLRKEGKEPKRSQNNALLQELEKTVLDTLLPAEPEEHDDSDQSCRKLIRTPIAPSFDIVTPPHAFPSPYPPICSYDPFPEQARRSFELPWLRSALAVQKPRSDVVVDMDELTTAFASLALSTEEPEKCEAPNTLSPLSCTTYLTPCPPAPLPALLRFGHHSFPATLTERRIRSPRADPRFGRTFHPVGSQPSSYRSQRKAKQSVQSPRQCLSSSNSLPLPPAASDHCPDASLAICHPGHRIRYAKATLPPPRASRPRSLRYLIRRLAEVTLTPHCQHLQIFPLVYRWFTIVYQTCCHPILLCPKYGKHSCVRNSQPATHQNLHNEI